MGKREVIMERSIDLFLEYGITGTTTKQILEKSGVSNGTLFNHFPTKEDLVKEMYFYIKDGMYKQVNEKTTDVVQFREFLWITWNVLIEFGINEEKKRKFYDSFKKLPIVRTCTSGRINSIYEPIFERIQEAIDKEIITCPNIYYFFLLLDRNVEAIIEYIQTNECICSLNFIKDSFNGFWRAIDNY